MKRWMHLMIAAAAAVGVACGSDSSAPIDPIAVATKTSGTDSSGNSGGGNTSGTSGNNTVGLVITPSSLTLAVGWSGNFTVATRDANGKLTPKRATLTSSNPSIVAIVGDTGLVHAKAVGSATVTATADGATAVASVTVTAAPPPAIPTPPAVSEFSVKIVAAGPIVGTDTSRIERIAGATVKLRRVGGISGDTLKTPIDAGSAVTDANGEVSFSTLPGGSYEVRITPAAGSPYDAGFMIFPPPRSANIGIMMVLRRK
jgi:hypothetical protein